MKIQELSINCLDCSASYVRDTGLELKLRIKEHKESIRKKLPTSPIYKHLEDTGHWYFDWDNASIKGHSKRKQSRLFLETCFTLPNDSSISRHVDIQEFYWAIINNRIHWIFFFFCIIFLLCIIFGSYCIWHAETVNLFVSNFLPRILYIYLLMFL